MAARTISTAAASNGESASPLMSLSSVVVDLAYQALERRDVRRQQSWIAILHKEAQVRSEGYARQIGVDARRASVTLDANCSAVGAVWLAVALGPIPMELRIARKRRSERFHHPAPLYCGARTF